MKSTTYKLRHTKHTGILLGFMLLIVLVPLVVFLARHPLGAKAWWNNQWLYRQKITVTNSGSTLTNYQVALTVDTASLISAGKLQSSCNDIRVTSGNTTQYHSIDNCNSATTKIWIKASSLPSGDSDFWVYYGNPSAPNVENGSQVFDFFDDFTGTSLNGTNWNNNGYDTYSYGMTGATISNSQLTITSDDAHWGILRNQAINYAPSDTGIIEAKVTQTAADQQFTLVLVQQNGTNTQRCGLYQNYNSPQVAYYVNSGDYVTSTLTTIQNGTPYLYRVEKLNSTDIRSSILNSDYTLQGSANTQSHGEWAGITWTMVAWKYDSHPTVYDWVRSRQYAATEPTTSTGDEQYQTNLLQPPVAYWKFDEGHSTPASEPITKLEQQIPLVNQTYTSGVNGYVPGDNSLGLFHYDASQYPGATISFEADYYTNEEAYVCLTTESGDLVSCFHRSNANRVRESTPVTLTDNTNYTVAIRDAWNGNNPVTLYDARLYIDQNSSPKLTATQGQIELGNTETTASTSYVPLTDPRYYYFNNSRFTPQPQVQFEATLSNDTGGQTANAALFEKDSSCTTMVTGSDVTQTGTTYALEVSGNLSLNTGTEYMVCFKAGANTARLANAKLILSQSATSGVTQVEVMERHLWPVSAISGTTYTSVGYLDDFNPTNLFSLGNGAQYQAYFEATIKTSGGTGYARLSDGVGEVTTTSSTYERVRSADIYPVLPTSNTSYYTQLKNSGGTTTTASNAWIISEINNAVQLTHDAVNQHHASIINSPTWNQNDQCVSHTCLSFNGTDQSLSVPDDNQLDFSVSDNFTLSGWLKHAPKTEATTEVIMAKLDPSSGSDGGYKVYLKPDKSLAVGLDTDNASFPENELASANITLDDNAWHQYTVVKQGTAHLYLYVDGRVVGSTTTLASSGTYANTDILHIGIDGDGTTNPYQGSLDEMKIYRYARSAAQILTDYNLTAAHMTDKSPAVTGAGPVGWWQFNDGSGITAADSTSNATTGNFGGGSANPTWSTSGKYGGALYFDGGDYVSMGDAAPLDITGNAITLECWAKLDSGNRYAGICGKMDDGDATSAYGLYFNNYSSNINWLVRTTTGVAVTSQTAITDGSWHYVVGTYDGTLPANQMKIYIDGQLEASGDLTGDISNSADNFYVGRQNSSSRYVTGLIDEVKVYDYARSAPQIIEDMHAGSLPNGLRQTSPFGYWRFNEGHGTTAFNTGVGGSAFDGQIAGSTWSSTAKQGRALTFSGGDDAVSVGYLNFYDTFSVSAWLYPTDLTKKRLIISRSSWCTNGIRGWTPFQLVVNKTGTLEVEVTGTYTCNMGFAEDSYVTDQAVITPNTWNQVTVTVSHNMQSDRTVKFFVNGVPVNQTQVISQSPQVVQDTSEPAIIGSCYVQGNTCAVTSGSDESVTTEAFKGSLDEFKYYNYALTDDQAKTEFNLGQAMVMGNSTADCVPGSSDPCAAPIAYWNLDDHTGSAPVDLSGNQATGAFTGTPTWVTGKIGGALSFSGSGQAVTATIANPGSANTLELWLYPTASVANKTLITSGKLATDGSANPTYGSCTGTALPINQWTHLVATSTDATHCAIYQNGQLTAESATTGVSLGTSINLAASSFAGKLDEVKVFNYARTPAQVAWDYNRGQPVAWYKFDECQGTAAHNTADLLSGGMSLAGTIIPNSGRSAGTCDSGADTEMWNGGTTGKYAGSLAFDGAGDHVGVPDPGSNSTLDFTSGQSLSVSAWVKPAATVSDFQTLVAKGDTNGTDNVNYYVGLSATNRLFFEFIDGSNTWHDGNSFANTITPSVWQHLVYVYTFGTGNLHLYLNGQEVPVDDPIESDAPQTNNDPLWLGSIDYNGCSSGHCFSFNGQIDDIQIFNYALTAEQVKLLYNNHSAVQFSQ